MDPITVVFEYWRSTKDTFQYKEVPSPTMEIIHEQPLPLVIGDLRIQKFVLGNQPPARLTITIEGG